MKKLKWNELEKTQLTKKQMSTIKGGDVVTKSIPKGHPDHVYM
jgi:natural product precursor